jgi:hypothetical protein
VSDIFKTRSVLGNLEQREEPGREIRRRSPRRLVEECETISVHAVQNVFGKKALILSIRQARPLRLLVLGGYFDIWPTDEPHRLPGRPARWSSLQDGNCRFWLICTGCRRKVGKLFCFYLSPDSLVLSDLLCRRCHGLVYQSENCGKNRWYREVARPLKWLLKEKGRLLAERHTPRIAARLAQIESAVQTLRQKLRPKAHRCHKDSYPKIRSRQRRPYRSLCAGTAVDRL